MLRIVICNDMDDELYECIVNDMAAFYVKRVYHELTLYISVYTDICEKECG